MEIPRLVHETASSPWPGAQSERRGRVHPFLISNSTPNQKTGRGRHRWRAVRRDECHQPAKDRQRGSGLRPAPTSGPALRLHLLYSAKCDRLKITLPALIAFMQFASRIFVRRNVCWRLCQRPVHPQHAQHKSHAVFHLQLRKEPVDLDAHRSRRAAANHWRM
jgi:hypothetical protein